MYSNHWAMSCKQETYRRLGDYIREVDVRNKENRLSENDLYGVSVTKEYIPTHANLVGVQFHNYKVVKTKQFTYIPDTSRRGDKIALALNLLGKEIIVSNVYTTFEVDEKRLLPEYLMMWFRRPEFDRYARYKSHGSAREVFDWEDMCDVLLPVPPIEEQRRIVSEYQTVERRIQNNELLIKKLEETAQAIYHHTFVEGIDENNLPQGWRMGHLGDIMNISSGKSVVDKVDQRTDYYKYPVAGASGIIGYSSLFNKEKRILTTGRVGTLGVINKYDEAVWCADNVLIAESEFYEFSCISLKNVKYEEISKGGVQALLTQGELNNYPIVVPVKEVLDNFESKVEPIFTLVKTYTHEIYHLRTLLSLLTSKLS